MRFGISQNIHDTSRARPYDQLVDEVREVATYCDQKGFANVWLPEHHFSIWGREMLPNPILFAADLAARTKSIRIGLSAAIATFWHPLRLAEDLAMLDQMAKGRLDIGFGRGNYGLEATNLNPAADPNDQDANFRVFEDTVGVVKAALGERTFSYKGPVYQFPAPGFCADRAHTVDDPDYVDPETNELVKLSVIPGPYQRPLPPLWQVVSESPRSMRYAAEHDMGIIMWRPTAATLKHRLGIYRDAYEEFHGRLIAFGAKTAIVRDTFVAESEAEARRIAEGPLMESLNFANWRGPRIYLDPGEEITPELEADLKREITYEFVRDRALFFGSVDEVVEKIKTFYEVTRMEQIIFKCTWPGLPHAQQMNCLRLLAEEVLPRLTAWHRDRFPEESAAE